MVVGSNRSKRWTNNCLRAMPAWGLLFVLLVRGVHAAGCDAGSLAEDCLVRDIAARLSFDICLAARALEFRVGGCGFWLRVR